MAAQSCGSVTRSIARRQDLAAGVLAALIGFAATFEQLRPASGPHAVSGPQLPVVLVTQDPAPAEPSVRERLETVAAPVESAIEGGWQRLADSATSDPNPTVRAEAVFALGEIGGARSAQAVGQALNDPSVLVRATAIDALGILRDADTSEFLLNALRDSHPRVRQAAWNALEDMREGPYQRN